MTSLTIHLPLPNFEITSVTETETQIVAQGETTESGVECRKCGEFTSYLHCKDKPRQIQHLTACGKMLFLEYSPRRYACLQCGQLNITTTATPEFHYVKSQFSYRLERHILLGLVNSTLADVSHKYYVSEDEVQGIVDRHLSGKVDWSRFKDLSVIGIDEISLKKGCHKYVTVVTALVCGKVYVLGVILGRKKQDIRRFLKAIPVRLKKTVAAVCVDMYIGYINAAKEIFKHNVAIIVDRYHVAKLYRKSLDKFRQTVINELKRHLSTEDYKKITGVTHLLRSNKEFFTEEEKAKLNEVFSHSFELAEAYRLVRKLTHLFNTHLTAKEGFNELEQWIVDIRKTKLTFLNTFIKTLTKHKNEIANYFISRQTSGFVEGFNNKLKVMKRRCYGISNLKHLFQRLTLDTSGYELYAENIGV